MGNGTYSFENRATRSFSCGYKTKSVNEIFTQNKKRVIHESMNPSGVVIRESRDSESHPNTIPIQLYLDVTASMGRIPHEMIKDGLPNLMGHLIQNGVPDAALMFGAIGDHECDQHPLQIGQFESGDEELDMWLTRTYLEGGGGANMGESYLLAWYFGANHVVTDAVELRGKKGYIITIGDEPCLPSLPASAVKEIMGESSLAQGSYTKEELLAEAQKNNHVYHIHINHGSRYLHPHWKQLLGDNLIEISDHTTISTVIANLILANTDTSSIIVDQDVTSEPTSTTTEVDDEQML